MLALDFPGSRKMIDAIDAAVAAPDAETLTANLRKTLCRLIRDPEVQLPACVFEPVGGHYARRELYVSDEHGYCVVAMTWGPGQGTPIHDHAGMWCVEGVWHGQLEITQYERLADDEASECCRFRSVGTLVAGAGSAGSLIPPHEYHTICNPSDDAVAISLHIYRGQMTCCSVFQPQGGDRYAKATRQLCLDKTA